MCLCVCVCRAGVDEGSNFNLHGSAAFGFGHALVAISGIAWSTSASLVTRSCRRKKVSFHESALHNPPKSDYFTGCQGGGRDRAQLLLQLSIHPMFAFETLRNLQVLTFSPAWVSSQTLPSRHFVHSKWSPHRHFMNTLSNSSLSFIQQKFTEYLRHARYYYRPQDHSSELNRQNSSLSWSLHFGNGRESDNSQNKETYNVC